jgi:hypothetical protein
MAPGSFLLKFKANLEVIIKLASGRRKRRNSRPPSQTISFILPDSSVQDVTHSLGEEMEYTFVVDLDRDVWREILSLCEVIDIIHIGMVHPNHGAY